MKQRELGNAIDATAQKLVQLLGAWKESGSEGRPVPNALWPRIRSAEDDIGTTALATRWSGSTRAAAGAPIPKSLRRIGRPWRSNWRAPPLTCAPAAAAEGGEEDADPDQ